MLHGLRLYQWSGMQAMVRGLGLLAPFAKLRAMEALLPPVPASAAPRKNHSNVKLVALIRSLRGERGGCADAAART